MRRRSAVMFRRRDVSGLEGASYYAASFNLRVPYVSYYDVLM
jgi:hypothetical protein